MKYSNLCLSVVLGLALMPGFGMTMMNGSGGQMNLAQDGQARQQFAGSSASGSKIIDHRPMHKTHADPQKDHGKAQSAKPADIKE